MHSLPSLRRTLVFIVLGLAPALHAQELNLLGGLTAKPNFSHSSYNYQLDYRQVFQRNFAASVAYINEGHVPGHHRDGTAWQLWGGLPLFNDRISFSLGVGAYYYFDTQPLPGGDSADVHGTAPIYSAAITGYFSDRWFYRINYNRISPAHQLAANTISVGAGFWFGQARRPTEGKLGDAPEARGYVTDNELTVFGGQSVVNTFLSQTALAYAAEYRRGIFPHIDWTLSGLYEGDPKIIRRYGVASQAWFVNSFFHERITLGVGVGPYVYLDRRHPASAPTSQINPAAVAPLASLTASVRLGEQWLVRLVLDRVASNYNRDSDVFLLGLGYRWPR